MIVEKPDRGTRVVAIDLNGESEAQDIVDDYCIVCDGRMEITYINTFANGTVQLTLKEEARVTTEIRSQLNVRLSQDANISVSVAMFVDTDEEAREAGVKSSRIVSAYIEGYNSTEEERE